MLSKCANPSCSNPFLYLNRGKLYRMEMDAGPPEASVSAADFAPNKCCRRIEYFWLCNECAPRMTLTFKKGVGIRATPAPRSEIVAIAAAAD
ncbi:MAG TPA: hypothetical protein VMH85_06510 [Terriglobales bacterium]|nr:hypothetical protein [Terriglobales bacterium]